SAMRRIVGILEGADRLTITLVREGCIRVLKDRGMTSPAKIVDAAFDRNDSPANSENQLVVDTQPWPEPVNLGELLNEMVVAQKRFVCAEPAVYHTVALWALFPHVFESFYCLPILLVTAATKRAGKTTLLSVLSRLVRRPIAASNLSDAV